VAVPLPLTGAPLELLWRNAQSDDEALRFIREHIARIAKVVGRKAASVAGSDRLRR
jgi:LysR family transcriptional regulator, mexEF-oprN operon transcriptional activator